MVFVGCHPTPRKGLSPLDPERGEESTAFQTSDAFAWRAANTGFFVNCVSLISIGLTQLDTKKANVRARAVREPPLQCADISGFSFSTA